MRSYNLIRSRKGIRDHHVRGESLGFDKFSGKSLTDFSDTNAQPFEWAIEVDERMRSHLIAGEHRDLIEYQSMGDEVSRAIPTLDHYLPMIYTIALQEEGEGIRFTYEGFQNRSISMRCFRIG